MMERSFSLSSTGLLSEIDIAIFQRIILDYFSQHGRDFAWRCPPYDPYHIVVSEVMLQQTQTYRVEPKFEQFIKQFPTFQALATATTAQVITAWQGLGYNRRALALQKIAQKVMQEYNGILPNSPDILRTFPGLGPTTSASICAFAFNRPVIFLETNIRSVYIHFFFNKKQNIKDKELLPLVEQTLYSTDPRKWYYALMDYGVLLKKTMCNPSRRSAHYTTQSKFEGSERQIRGMILKVLATYHAATFELLCESIRRDPKRIERNLENLKLEGFIRFNNNMYSLQQ